MSDDDLQTVILSDEMEEWLETIASTCIAHMHYIEQSEAEDPTALSVDDYGLLELERAYLALYSLHKKGALPPSTDEPTH